jgi:diacylglycerol kinase family enzyme
VNEIINALMDIPRTERPAFGVLPAGTANDFARAIGHRNWRHVLDSAAEGTTRPVDIGVAEGAFGRRYFGVAAFAGAPALMARKANEGGKRWRGLAGYLPYLGEALGYSAAVTVDFGSHTWAAQVSAVAVTNTPNGAGGRLDIVFVPAGRTIPVLLSALSGSILSCGGVRHASIERVVMSGDNVDLALDGEIVGQLPATIEVVPFALDVLQIGR